MGIADNMTDELQVVVFALDNSYYGVHILKVQEIIKMTEITKLPNTPIFVEGVVNLRGKIKPVMDLRRIARDFDRKVSNKNRLQENA